MAAAEQVEQKVSPQDAFRNRIGVESTPLNVSDVSSSLLTAMEQVALGYRAFVPNDFDRARVHLTLAAVSLFPDGPVKAFGSESNTTHPTSRTVGENARVLVDELVKDGDVRPMTTAFKRLVEIVSDVSGVDLRFLNMHFIKETPSEVAKLDSVKVSVDRASFFQNGGILTRDTYAKINAEEMDK